MLVWTNDLADRVSQDARPWRPSPTVELLTWFIILGAFATAALVVAVLTRVWF